MSRTMIVVRVVFMECLHCVSCTVGLHALSPSPMHIYMLTDSDEFKELVDIIKKDWDRLDAIFPGKVMVSHWL